jgi:hypothetical protein
MNHQMGSVSNFPTIKAHVARSRSKENQLTDLPESSSPLRSP